MSDFGFQRTLDHIRAIADSEMHKGRLFERLMRRFFELDVIYRDRFSNVWLWSEWPSHYPGFDAQDTGIDLVAQERDGGYCAIQCKCYAPGTRIAKPHIDSFIAAPARDPFTSRILVDTGDSWGVTAARTIANVKPACTVLRFGDLASRPFDWPDLVRDKPEELRRRAAPYELRPHQRRAHDDVANGFEHHDRGKLVMACGTGKTFTALKIAETLAGKGGRVLYLVPSISLLQQSMREWAEQAAFRHRYIGICSDMRAGRTNEDAALVELEIPVTTDPVKIRQALAAPAADAMTVAFCTYHSLPLVERAQASKAAAHEVADRELAGLEPAPPFDLVLCDEAHRTTGVDAPTTKRTSPFVRIHDPNRIRADKRLYMTATPRIYTESSKRKATAYEADVFSMDDERTYGPEFHRLAFSRAIEEDLLSDYKVVILAVSEHHVDPTLQSHLAAQSGSEININDTAKIVGCWRALQRRGKTGVAAGSNGANGEGARPLKRAIAFANTIASSRRLETHWDNIVEHAISQLPEPDQPAALRCHTRHVDGKHNALDRRGRLEWLRGDDEGVCRILSNARCLSEGIDVPALDAVLFMAPKASQVDIVQAVRRVMRKSPGKKYGYIVLPVAVPAGVPAAEALNDHKRFAVVWSVLRALRSHDDRFDAEINRIDLNKKPPDVIIIDDGTGGDGDDNDQGDGSEQLPLDFPPLMLPPGAIYAKIVDKCGDRKYWETWARDIADIFDRLVARIRNLLENREHDDLHEWFQSFHDELRASVNQAVTREDAIEMVAQHILTGPVFDALFKGYDFTSGNPIARALDRLRTHFGEFGLENEIRDMERSTRASAAAHRDSTTPKPASAC